MLSLLELMAEAVPTEYQDVVIPESARNVVPKPAASLLNIVNCAGMVLEVKLDLQCLASISSKMKNA